MTRYILERRARSTIVCSAGGGARAWRTRRVEPRRNPLESVESAARAGCAAATVLCSGAGEHPVHVAALDGDRSACPVDVAPHGEGTECPTRRARVRHREAIG
jgi:hypothetical protein